MARLTVTGFKSLRDAVSIELGGLTLLAGGNSSGKSSVVQPLLLLKQTLEATYDPGPLLLNGPNVRFSSAEQMFFAENRQRVHELTIGANFGADDALELHFRRPTKGGVELVKMLYRRLGRDVWLEEGQPPPPSVDAMELPSYARGAKPRIVQRSRCFLGVTVEGFDAGPWFAETPLAYALALNLRGLIHVPGLRGNPLRSYPVTAVGNTFPGPFQDYVASILAHWQREKQPKLRSVADDLAALGLTWKVSAAQLTDTEVEIRVGRLRQQRRGGARDLVSIADVGFGVSQVLPVVVALHAAEQGQLVYIEQPEIHMHPSAQVAMAKVLAGAVRRGVRLIVETHSSLLLLALQTLVAREQLDRRLLRLHWFERDETGSTSVTTAEVDETGAFGDWPEDFAMVEMRAQDEFLSAVSDRARRQ